MKNFNLLFITLSLMISLVSACTSPTNIQDEQTTSVRAWFDAPLPNSIYVPLNPCQIVAHGASPNGIASFELSINGAVSNVPSPDTQNSLVTLTQDCGLSEPGEYLLQLRAQDNDGHWSGYAETSLTIAGDATQTPSPAPEETVTIIPTLTLTPTLTATAEPSEGVSIEEVSTNLVYIGQASCGTQEVTITARAVASNEIDVVVLFYRFQTGNSSSEFQSLSMNSIGDDLYQRILTPTSLLGGSVPFDQATLQYQIIIQQDNGDTSLRTPVLSDITVQACGSVAACSSYTEERPCIANGCNWVLIPGTVPLYECQNP